MAEIVDYELLKRLMESSRVKASKVPVKPNEYMGYLLGADANNLDLLMANGIELVPSEWDVLAIENEELNKTLLRAKDLGFLDAYVQNPSYIKRNVDTVISRIGESEHLGIPYKSESGKYKPFLFGNRAYNYVVGKAKGSAPEEKSDDVTPSETSIELKELADRLMEVFNKTDDAQIYYSRLEEAKDLSAKEALIYAFKDTCDLDTLIVKIDEVLDNNRRELGMVA